VAFLLLNNDKNVQECDATTVRSSQSAWLRTIQLTFLALWSTIPSDRFPGNLTAILSNHFLLQQYGVGTIGLLKGHV
jgi:hypothetical protein